MSLKARLLASYLLFVLFLAGFGGTALTGRRRGEREAAALTAVYAARVRTVQDAVIEVNENGLLTMEELLAPDPKARELQARRRGSNRSGVTSRILALERVLESPEERALLSKVKEARAPYLESLARVESLARRGRRAEAERALAKETAPRLAQFNAAWAAFLESQRALLDRASAARLASFRSQSIWLAALLLLGALGLNRLLAFLARQVERDIALRESALRRKDVLYAASLANFKEKDVTAIVTSVLQNICGAMRWRQGAYWLLDEAGGVLRCAAFWTVPGRASGRFEAISRSTALPPGVGLPGRVWQSRSPAWIPDVVEDKNFPRALAAREEGLHAAFAFPVLLEGKLHGVLEFFNDKIEPPDAELLQMMAATGEQIGLFMTHKQTEESLRLSRLNQSEKMAALGQLAAGVSHEINNPLGIILGFAQSALRQASPSDPLRGPLQSIEREAMRCKALVASLLGLSRRSGPAKAEFDLSSAVSDALTVLEPEARRRGVSVGKELASGTRVVGDRTQIQQVLVNLCSNALDAMPQGGRLTVRASPAAAEKGPGTLLCVQDTGTGIPEELLGQIFNPFFTTKEVGKGTGLGLSLVYEIVSAHGGTIEVKSVLGQGSLFSVFLPAPAPAPAKEPGARV